jgi:hypothetical protein
VDNKFLNWIVLIFSAALLLAMAYTLFDDIVFFLTKKETSAKVLKVKHSNNSDTYNITLQYFNTFEDSEIICNYKAKPYFGNKMMNRENEILQIHYGKLFPQRIYIIEDRTPRLVILLFELLIIGLMFFLIKGCVSSIQKTVQLE